MQIKTTFLWTLVAVLILGSSQSLRANFDFNSNCQNAYQNILSLRFSAAKQYIAVEKKAHPQNGIVPWLENCLDYFYLLTNESKSEFERLEANKSARLSSLSKNDRNSPYYLYAQADINLQWALIRSRYGEYFSASREINKANSLYKDNQAKFPDFHLNLKGIGLINVVMGALPDGFMKSTLATFGIKGNLAEGLAQLDKLANNLPKSYYEPFYEEVVFSYVYILSDVAKTDDAYVKTMKLTARFADSSLLKTYLQAYVSARHGRSEQAISILQNRPRGASYSNFAYLDYLLGVVRLNKLDLGAKTNFIQFLQKNRGDNYVKDTFLHLAWISLLSNDSSGYLNYLQKVKDSGKNYAFQDKQALTEASQATPSLLLLKARLLWDGGYYGQALEVLSGHSVNDFKTSKDKLEFHYRLARIFEKQNRDELALAQFQATINLGKSSPYYYAAKSALLLAQYYEEKRNRSKSIAFYKQVLSMRDYEYENSISNDAKQGLRRLGN
jgi:hypothetical protein